MKRRWDTFWCYWFGFHKWDCDQDPNCNGRHRCVRCGKRPYRVRSSEAVR